MISNMKPKEATAVINALTAGVVPKTGIQHITVGRTKEVDACLKALREIQSGHSLMKFWIGEYGCGKSFMLHLLDIVALKQKLVVASTDFTPEKRLYSNDGKATALYSALMNNLSISTKPEGGALITLLEKWLEQVLMETAQQKDIPVDEIRDAKHTDTIKESIMKTINGITDTGSFDFGMVLLKYYEGYVTENDDLCKNAVKWLKGEYTTRMEARRDLGVRVIIDDRNYFHMLKNFAVFFTYIGYSGFMINLDEAGNLYKITHASTRAKNYETILSIYNDCFQGKTSHMFINIAGINEFLENPRRGLYSYSALRTRLEGNLYETARIRDFSQPVIKLLPLSNDEIFVLLQKLKAIFDFHFSLESNIDERDIHRFMESVYNKPGADEFLTPREVIKEFLNILSILRQNPGLSKSQLFGVSNVDAVVESELGFDVEEF
ncbi:MAG: biotin carboxylase [bacterium]|nr:biotin carboxylase [bacterium]